MMTPAPYTPDTVARIRRDAVARAAPSLAADLGWDIPSLTRIAARHQIALLMPEEATTERTNSPIRREAPPRHERSQPLTASMTLDEIAKNLSTRHRLILEMLKATLNGSGFFVPSIQLAIVIGCVGNVNGLAVSISGLRQHLRPTRYTIESARGRGKSGYRLVVLGSE